MTRFHWMTSFVLVAVLAAGTLAFAQGRGGRRGGGFAGGPELGGPGRGAVLGLGVRGLDLSDAQREQIRAITARAREDSKPLVDRLRQAADARRKALATMPVDENQIRATTQALTAAEADMAVARAHLQSDIFNVLTPEQQAKVTEARASREARLAERRSRMEERRQQRQPQGNN